MCWTLTSLAWRTKESATPSIFRCVTPLPVLSPRKSVSAFSTIQSHLRPARDPAPSLPLPRNLLLSLPLPGNTPHPRSKCVCGGGGRLSWVDACRLQPLVLQQPAQPARGEQCRKLQRAHLPHQGTEPLPKQVDHQSKVGSSTHSPKCLHDCIRPLTPV